MNNKVQKSVLNVLEPSRVAFLWHLKRTPNPFRGMFTCPVRRSFVKTHYSTVAALDI